jgi:predicted O-methyltransferase YrrM
MRLLRRRRAVLADLLEGIPHLRPDQGLTIQRHLKKTRAKDALEIGTAHGVGAAYMAATGARVTTVDHAETTPDRDPHPDDVLARAGVTDLVTRVEVPDSSYDWWLKDHEGSYDFIFVDGAHHFTIDGLAVILCAPRLRSGGWILFDDVEWTYDSWWGSPDQIEQDRLEVPQSPTRLGLSEAERTTPHIREVVNHVLRPHPSFTNVRVDGEWAWAQKVAG